MAVITLPQFPSHPTCTLCDLHETPDIQHPGTPTILLNPGQHPPSAPVLILVGQNPGFHEDRSNIPFVGPSGKLVRGPYLLGARLPDIAHIYITNAARCLSPSNDAPKARHLRACSNHLRADLETIYTTHVHSPLYILALGGIATTALSRLSTPKPPFSTLSEAFSHQATPIHVQTAHHLVPLSFFATYHPAAILRLSKLIYAVNDHLFLLRAHICNTEPTPQKPTIVPVSLPPLLENPHEPYHRQNHDGLS